MLLSVKFGLVLTMLIYQIRNMRSFVLQLEEQFETEAACLNYLKLFWNLDPCDQSLLNFTERGLDDVSFKRQ